MRAAWVLLAIATITATAVAAVAQAGPPSAELTLAANAPHVVATASLSRTSLGVSVGGLPARAQVEATIHVLACAQAGYGRRPAGGALTDAAGRAHWSATGVLTRRVRDGRHVLALGIGGRTIACASIPAAANAPRQSRRRHWGIWTFTRRFID